MSRTACRGTLTLATASGGRVVVQNNAGQLAAAAQALYSRRRVVTAEDVTRTRIVVTTGLSALDSYTVRLVTSATDNTPVAWNGTVTATGGVLELSLGATPFAAGHVVEVMAIGTAPRGSRKESRYGQKGTAVADLEFDADEMAAQVASLDAKLSKAETVEETESLVKSLANVAEGSVDLANEVLGTKRRKKTATSKSRGRGLAKAAKDKAKDKDEDDDDEDDEDDEPDFIKKLVHDGKSAGEMIYAYDRTDTGTHTGTNAGGEHKTVGKSQGAQTTRLGGRRGGRRTVLGWLAPRAKRLRKALAEVAERQEAQIEALGTVVRELYARQEAMAKAMSYQMQYAGVMAKGLGVIVEQQETVLAQPSGSKFDRMQKSLPAIQAELKAQGGTQVPYDKEKAGKALLKGAC